MEILQTKVRIQLTDGRSAPMRDNYAKELWKWITNRGEVDAGWLHASTHETFFLSRDGEKLCVLLAPAEPSANEAQESMHLVLDQSSSMQTMQASVYAGAKELVETLPATAMVTFTTFSTLVDVGRALPRDDVVGILSTAHIASGSTSLYDAIVQSVNLAGREPGRVTVVVVTDGQDTSSKEATRGSVREAIAGFQQDPMHRILFLGTNQDAVVAAQALGIPVDSALTFGTDATHVRSAFRSVSENVGRMRSGDNQGFNVSERTRAVSAQ